MDDFKEDIKELYELTAKLARRCAYDLRHLVEASSPDFREIYMPRLENYETIFEAASGTKDYRHRLHRKISELESQTRKLTELLKSNNIEIPKDNPF